MGNQNDMTKVAVTYDRSCVENRRDVDCALLRRLTGEEVQATLHRSALGRVCGSDDKDG